MRVLGQKSSSSSPRKYQNMKDISLYRWLRKLRNVHGQRRVRDVLGPSRRWENSSLHFSEDSFGKQHKYTMYIRAVQQHSAQIRRTSCGRKSFEKALRKSSTTWSLRSSRQPSTVCLTFVNPMDKNPGKKHSYEASPRRDFRCGHGGCAEGELRVLPNSQRLRHLLQNDPQGVHQEGPHKVQ